MLKRYFTYLLVFFFFSIKIIAQVNLQTGSATFSLPIFNWQDDKSRLNSVIALSYSSGNGLRVNDVASNVGQGWNLISGGVITRMQVGLPDDQVARPGNDDDIKRYPAGVLYASTAAYKGCPTALTKYPIFRNKNQMYAQHNSIGEDKELDYFSFQFNGKGGMFVLDPTNMGVAHSIGDTKMKITFQEDANLQNQGIRTKITSFTIQDVDGLIYKFARHSLTKVLRSSYCHGNLTERLTQPKFKSEHVYYQTGFDDGVFANPYIIGSWYLTEIEDALTHRKVYFNYETRNINSRAGEDIMYNKEKDYSVIYYKKSITQTPGIVSIVYPDGHTATFNYGNFRFDLNGDKVLASVDITYQERYLSRHELNTTYVMLNRYGTPVSDYQKSVSRLYLKSVRKIGIDLKEDSPPYIFDYYLGSSNSDDFVPPPFFYAKDVWGYFNGDNSKGYWNESIPLNTTISRLSGNQTTLNKQLRGLCFLRNGVTGVFLNTKSGYAKNGLLRQIIYPTGGTLTYEYEQNNGVLNGNNTDVGGVHVLSTSSTDGGYSNNCSTPVITQYYYVMNGPNSASSLWGLEMPENVTFSTSHYEPESRYYKWAGCFPLGCCDWRFQYPGIMSQQQAISLTDLQKALEVVSAVMEIVNVVSTISNIITTVTGGSPVSLIIDIIVGLIEVAVTCIGNQARDNNYTTYYNFDLNGISPLPSQFKRVEVVENPGTIGKTVHEFTSSDNYAVWELDNPNYAAKQRFASWAYGLPKLTTVFDASGNTVKQTENVYSFANAKNVIHLCYFHPGPDQCQSGNNTNLQTNLVSCKCVVKKNTSQRNTTWSDPSQYNNPSSYITESNSDMNVDFYAMYTGRVELTSTKERIYKPSDQTQYVETVTSYTYNSTYNYEVNNITIIQSNGGSVSKSIKYSSDYSGGPITTLVNNNIVSLPVETVTSVNNPGGNTGVIGESVTEFTQLTNGDIRPSRTLERRFTQPTNTTIFYQGPTGDNSSLNFKETQTFTYGNNSNLIGLKDEGSRLITNLYDYNDKYIVAYVINADAVLDKCAYAGFEPLSNGWIGWTLNGVVISYSSNALTGIQALSISSGTSFSRTLNTAKPYIVSFWSTTSTISVSGGATLIKSSPTLNGFTYYEYDIVQGTASVTVSGTGIIDELRLYPKSARMRTTTYDPLIGKTSECDENNRVVYYEYDNLGRLRFVKDESRNIVKMYEYNNISPAKQNGCPGIYYNRMVSEVFTKSNCGSGYIGSDVTYTVPANTYSSAISQADADAQAENNILTNGQAYANTNGTCAPIYYNTAQSQGFTSQTCPPGYTGGTVTYTVPAGRYSSTISQADANQMALDEIESNGQAFANDPVNRICNYSTAPLWEWLEGAAWYCLSVNGNLPPHLFVLETDVNPNSSTYLQTRWSNVGPSDMCPAGNYYNSMQSQNFTRNNCPSGYVGSVVTYTVSPGTYSSIVSQAAADQLALNAIAANGQNYANTNGTCTPEGCTYANCNATAADKRCVNGVCETGYRVNTDSYFDGTFWVCVYHYEWSDGYWSNNYYEYNYEPCAF